MSGGFQRNKKDDDSGLGWKFLGAAAIAGAAAAAVYGAKKLYDYLEEETSKSSKEDEEIKKPGKPKWEDPYYNKPDRNSNQKDFGGGSSMGNPLQTLINDPNIPLQNKLLEYHNGYVNIPNHEMERAREVLWRVKKPILKYLQERHPNVVTELKDCGSTSEGLKVICPDEFDIMIPLQVAPYAFKTEKETDVPGFFVLKKSDPGLYSSLDEFTVKSSDNETVYLSPQKLRSHFQNIIQEAVKEITRFKIYAGAKGPSIMFRVEYDGNKKIDIDFVPVVELGEMQVIGEPHPEYLRNGNYQYEKYWRESFTMKEWDILSSRSLPENSCHKKCLKIAKAARLNNMPQLGMFSSYVFKTLMLNMISESEYSEEWEEDALQERFIDFFNIFLLHLQKGNLPHHFDPFINLLDEYDDVAISNAISYLKKIVTTNRFEVLLKSNYSKQ